MSSLSFKVSRGLDLNADDRAFLRKPEFSFLYVKWLAKRALNKRIEKK